MTRIGIEEFRTKQMGFEWKGVERVFFDDINEHFFSSLSQVAMSQ